MLVNPYIIADIKPSFPIKGKGHRTVDHQQTLMYWYIGKRIFEEEQQGKNRSDLWQLLDKYLLEHLQPEFGSGFSVRLPTP